MAGVVVTFGVPLEAHDAKGQMVQVHSVQAVGSSFFVILSVRLKAGDMNDVIALSPNRGIVNGEKDLLEPSVSNAAHDIPSTGKQSQIRC